MPLIISSNLTLLHTLLLYLKPRTSHFSLLFSIYRTLQIFPLTLLYLPSICAAAEMQAIDRTHRIGQHKPIFATRFIIGWWVISRYRCLYCLIYILHISCLIFFLFFLFNYLSFLCTYTSNYHFDLLVFYFIIILIFCHRKHYRGKNLEITREKEASV